MEGERKRERGETAGEGWWYVRDTLASDRDERRGLQGVRNGARLVDVGARTMERAELRGRETRERASGGEGFKYKDTEACAVLSY